jgi:hypothetical protein
LPQLAAAPWGPSTLGGMHACRAESSICGSPTLSKPGCPPCGRVWALGSSKVTNPGGDLLALVWQSQRWNQSLQGSHLTLSAERVSAYQCRSMGSCVSMCMSCFLHWHPPPLPSLKEFQMRLVSSQTLGLEQALKESQSPSTF